MENCYIVRLKDNELLCFYYSNEKSIVYKRYENNKWSKATTILENTQSHYTIGLDAKGIIYLFCQDFSGDMILSTNHHAQWNSRVILKNHADHVYSIQLHPIITENGICLVYNIPSPEDKSNYIVFQKLDENGQWSPASRIDKFANMTDCLYHVQHISNEHMLLYYQTRTPENNLGYREITPSKQSVYHVFHTSTYQIVDSSFLTTNQAIHVLYVVKGMFSNQLMYRKKESGSFSNPVVLWEGQKLERCLLYFVHDTLYATYINNGQLYMCTSDDRGNTFSRPFRYGNKFCLHPVKAIYLSEIPQKEHQFYCRQLYVDRSSIWDIQLLPDLYEDFYPSQQAPVRAEIKAASLPTPAVEPVNPEFNENLFKMQNQLALSQKQNEAKDAQIMQLTGLLRTRNEEISQLNSDKKDLYKAHADEISELKIKLASMEALNDGLLKRNAALETEKLLFKTVKAEEKSGDGLVRPPDFVIAEVHEEPKKEVVAESLQVVAPVADNQESLG